MEGGTGCRFRSNRIERKKRMILRAKRGGKKKKNEGNRTIVRFISRRRWRLPWSRSRGPAPSPDSNYGFHTQARQTEANVESTNGPYSVLNSQSSGPYSVLNTQNGPYTPSTASYSVLETPVPLWGPPPPYSDPNSPARRPQVAEQRPRIAKRIDNFENNEGERGMREKNRTELCVERKRALAYQCVFFQITDRGPRNGHPTITRTPRRYRTARTRKGGTRGGR